jgi:arginine-tRNA-protein transferase
MPMVSDTRIKFYLTPAHECSYFSERQATTLFVDPRAAINTNHLAMLTESGFRRSGDYTYRPHCETCQACESLRVPIQSFIASKSQKRVFNKNKDLKVSIISADYQQEHFDLYERYINERHKDGDMYPTTESQYRSFLLAPIESCRFIEYRQATDNKLVAVSVIDVLPNALSAIYTFFDPNEEARSLGTFAILWQLKYCVNENLKFLYLGYYIKDSKKMSYKNKFRPYQVYKNDDWHNPNYD